MILYLYKIIFNKGTSINKIFIFNKGTSINKIFIFIIPK
jgi:hypothetical protein